MPNDPYAVLRALLRAEAARTTRKPSPSTERDRPKAQRPSRGSSGRA